MSCFQCAFLPSFLEASPSRQDVDMGWAESEPSNGAINLVGLKIDDPTGSYLYWAESGLANRAIVLCETHGRGVIIPSTPIGLRPRTRAFCLA